MQPHHPKQWGAFHKIYEQVFFRSRAEQPVCVCARRGKPVLRRQSQPHINGICFRYKFHASVQGVCVCRGECLCGTSYDHKCRRFEVFFCSWSLDISTFHPVVALLSANCIFRLSSNTSKHVTRFTKCHGNTFFYCSPNYNNIQVIVFRKTDDQNALCYYLRHPAPEDGKRSNYCEQNQPKPR